MLQHCSCCESLRILADRSGSFSICFSESLGIHADLQRCGDLSNHPSLPFRCFKSYGKYGGSGEYFSTDLVQCDGASWQLRAGWFPLTGLPWKPPCLGLKCLGPLPTLKALVPMAMSLNFMEIKVRFSNLNHRMVRLCLPTTLYLGPKMF